MGPWNKTFREKKHFSNNYLGILIVLIMSKNQYCTGNHNRINNKYQWGTEQPFKKRKVNKSKPNKINWRSNQIIILAWFYKSHW